MTIGRIAALCVLFGTTGCLTAAAADGAFSGRVVVELVDDIEHDHRLRLLEDFTFRDSKGRVWVAQKGGIVDGLLAPEIDPSWVRLPYAARLRKAAIVHDYFVATKTQQWRDVDRMYYEANVAEGVSAPEAKIVFMLTYATGWRWEPRGSSCYGSCHAAAAMLAWKPVLELEALRPLAQWIWSADPGLDEIERRTGALIRKPGPHLFSQGY